MNIFIFRELPIRQKLMVIIMVITGAALILSAVGIMGSDSLLFRGYLERDIEGLARITAENTTAAISFDDPKAATDTLTALHARTHLIAACVYRKDGSLLANYARPGATRACPKPEDADHILFTASALIDSHPIILRNARIGTVVLAYDLGEIRERQRLYGGTVLGVLLTSSLIAFILSSRLRDTIAVPILELVRATNSVSANRDYGVRARKLSTDELGLLVDAFNEMLAGIQVRDSELRRALVSREDALGEASQARDSLATTLASIGDAVISTDLEGRVLFANRVALALLGRTEEELAGRQIGEVFQIVSEFTRRRLEQPLTEVLRNGLALTLPAQTLLIGSNGVEIPIEGSGAPVRREGGPVQGAVLVFRDVTSRRHADETSRLLASIVESSGDAIIASDLAGTITSWNAGAEHMFGYPAADTIGRSLTILAAPGHESDVDRILDRIRQGERIRNFETLRRTKSGDTIHVSLTVSPVYDALGRIVGASKIARDITPSVLASNRLAELNSNLRESNESLARSNEDLERFAFVASHDLQEPLRMITVFSQLLIRLYSAETDERASAYIHNIVSGTQRMRELLADLLAYTEVGADVEQPLEPVDLNTLLERVLDNLKVTIAAADATITIDRLPLARVHASHIVSLFQNLISNAIKYRGPKAPCIHISARGVQSPESQEQVVQFSVSDNGIGIEPEYHDKIFVAFKRLHGKSIPGTGIGLAICQRVVERYGGRIWVNSEPGRGSTFYFTLPQAVEQWPNEARAAYSAVNTANGANNESDA